MNSLGKGNAYCQCNSLPPVSGLKSDETLHAYYGATLLSAQPSVREFYVRVARLGGHQNRKGDGMPGWLTLWRGWMKLQEMVNGYVHGKKTSPTCRKT